MNNVPNNSTLERMRFRYSFYLWPRTTMGFYEVDIGCIVRWTNHDSITHLAKQ
jgi:hypothetical protein